MSRWVIVRMVFVLAAAIGGFLSTFHGWTSDDANPEQSKSEPAAQIKPVERPARVLDLPKPKLRKVQCKGQDCAEVEWFELSLGAGHAASDDKYDEAALYQSWLVHRKDRGRYDLACYESQAGHVDEALYWLQEAAYLEGVGLKHAVTHDADLANIRKDKRFAKLIPYLESCQAYWIANAKQSIHIIKPRRDDGKTERLLLIWLHGMGGMPDSNQTPLFYGINDEGMFCVGVSGTVQTGEESFAWADTPDLDLIRVKAAIEDAKTKLKIKPGRIVIGGFSQGAMVAVELAVRNPDLFAGAITVSAGTGPIQLDDVKDKSKVKNQAFTIICGDQEAVPSVTRSKKLELWLKEAGAQVRKPNFPRHFMHAFPSNASSQMSEWIRFVRDKSKDEPPSR